MAIMGKLNNDGTLHRVNFVDSYAGVMSEPFDEGAGLGACFFLFLAAFFFSKVSLFAEYKIRRKTAGAAELSDTEEATRLLTAGSSSGSNTGYVATNYSTVAPAGGYQTGAAPHTMAFGEGPPAYSPAPANHYGENGLYFFFFFFFLFMLCGVVKIICANSQMMSIFVIFF
jgi:hypothetical protein